MQVTFKATFDLVVGRYAGVFLRQLLIWRYGFLARATPHVEGILVVAALSLLYAGVRLNKQMTSGGGSVKDKSE